LEAVDEYNKKSNANPPYVLKKILKASTQVVSGVAYRFELELVQNADCKKGILAFKSG
jgi:hypothetical protein